VSRVYSSPGAWLLSSGKRLHIFPKSSLKSKDYFLTCKASTGQQHKHILCTKNFWYLDTTVPLKEKQHLNFYLEFQRNNTTTS
jgi:hypothetical protein